MSNFVAVEADIVHERNDYHLYLTGHNLDTNFQMVDPDSNGKYLLIMDRAHPVGIIFNEGECSFKGTTFEDMVKNVLGS